MSEKVPDGFECQICRRDTTTFTVVKENNGVNGPGHREWVTHYQSDGCSTMFGDPAKFFKERHCEGGKFG